MSEQLPVPWRYARGQRVRHRDSPTTPYRVIGRSLLEMDAMMDRVTYYVQPWLLTGQYMIDRPLLCDEIDLQPWPEEEPHVPPTQ